jgi:hypothetical protein
MRGAFEWWGEIEMDSRGGAKLLRNFISFYHQAYHAAVWSSHHDIL